MEQTLETMKVHLKAEQMKQIFREVYEEAAESLINPQNELSHLWKIFLFFKISQIMSDTSYGYPYLLLQLIINRFSTIESLFTDKYLSNHLKIRESLFSGYDLDKTVVSSHSSLVEAMVSFLTDGEPSFN
jgi:hypothetical protein